MAEWKFAGLDEKPGTLWTESEFACVLAWWQEPQQLRLIWHYAGRYLGRSASREDVEDAVVEFFSLLEKVRQSYKPSGMSFFTYAVCVCFKHHCVRAAQRIQQRRQGQVPLYRDTANGEEFVLELVDGVPENDPAQRAQYAAFLKAVSTFLAEGYLSDNQRRAFILRIIEGMSYEEVAVQLNAPLGSVKGWVHRATGIARVYLTERGWDT
jgi:RNA polymerase sigma factor (sigma-70 family)